MRKPKIYLLDAGGKLDLAIKHGVFWKKSKNRITAQFQEDFGIWVEKPNFKYYRKWTSVLTGEEKTIHKFWLTAV